MQYVAIRSCPEDGQYTIVHSAVGCYSPTWLNVQRDHTGDPNGYFMLVNASYQPSDFYVQTISRALSGDELSVCGVGIEYGGCAE